MKETCGIHAKYMRDTCILRGNQDACGIHAGYMRDTCGIHAGYLPDVFGQGKYGTSGVNSRGGKQNYKDEWCAWKRFARDGRNFRVLPGPRAHHWLLLPGGLLALPDRGGRRKEDEKEEADDADDADEQPPAKKKIKEDKRAEAPAEAAEASRAPKAAAKAAKAAAMAPKESPRRASTRGRK